MSKFVFVVCFFFLPLLLQVVSLYAGEVCYDEGQNGICTILEKCEHLVQMVKNAGAPMPLHIWEKLTKLSCGFAYNSPMVCCTTSDNIGTPHTIQEDDASFHHTHKDPDIYVWGTTDDTNLNSVTYNKTVETNSLEAPLEKYGNDNDIPTLPNVQNHPNLGLLPESCGISDGERVLGGTRTALLEMPWMVLISYNTGRKTEQNCGGTLISEYYVLTAAHCVSFLRDGTTLNGVILGEHDLSEDPDCTLSSDRKFCAPAIINATIDQVIPHPGFSPDTMFHDIALIRLARPVNFESASTSPICLPITPKLQRESLIGKNVTIAGWGLTNDRIQSTVLLRARIPVLENDLCQKAYKRSVRITPKQICAGGIEDLDSCNGDSGGPLLFHGELGETGVRFIQRGIISFGSLRCGVKDSPTVYTNVAYYVDWILDNISK